ncbi:hypothetical protein K402DRAFT_420815 [Aulographum hederae CBS 113979]|uniref:Uncharacterized protein n=1 Tax=Aulographum hederae CBS 113979 TaxID=1176131 RepID=A0A6G1H0N8_9PEZI|nr:hypothetical protein K402DRAFT_420815 [Aulographum hederae CBS 113979]
MGLPRKHPKTLDDLSEHDMDLLTQVLSGSPPLTKPKRIPAYERRVKKQIKELPRHLVHHTPALEKKVQDVLLRGSARVILSGTCKLHSGLLRGLLWDIWNAVNTEIRSGIPNLLAKLRRKELLKEFHEDMMEYVNVVPSMWMSPTAYQERYNRSIYPKWAKQQDSCPGCMLTRLGDDVGVLIMLRVGFMGRVKSSKWENSKRLAWYDAWIRQISINHCDDPKSVRITALSTTIALELRDAYHLIRALQNAKRAEDDKEFLDRVRIKPQTREPSHGGGGSHQSGSGPSPTKEGGQGYSPDESLPRKPDSRRRSVSRMDSFDNAQDAMEIDPPVPPSPTHDGNSEQGSYHIPEWRTREPPPNQTRLTRSQTHRVQKQSSGPPSRLRGGPRRSRSQEFSAASHGHRPSPEDEELSENKIEEFLNRFDDDDPFYDPITPAEARDNPFLGPRNSSVLGRNVSVNIADRISRFSNKTQSRTTNFYQLEEEVISLYRHNRDSAPTQRTTADGSPNSSSGSNYSTDEQKVAYEQLLDTIEEHLPAPARDTQESQATSRGKSHARRYKEAKDLRRKLASSAAPASLVPNVLKIPHRFKPGDEF